MYKVDAGSWAPVPCESRLAQLTGALQLMMVTGAGASPGPWDTAWLWIFYVCFKSAVLK